MSNDSRSNNYRRERYGRRSPQAQQSAPRKQPPAPGLIILKGDGSNFSAAFKANKDHFMATFGPPASFLETGERFERRKPTLADIRREFRNSNEFTAKDLKRILLTRLAEFDRLSEKDREAEQKMFGLLLQLIEDDGRDRVESHDDWGEAYVGFDAFLLAQIIHSVHTARVYSGISEREARTTAMEKFRQTRQLQDSLTKYKEDIKARVKVLQDVGHPNIPSDLEIASHALNNLDPERYGEFMVDVINAERKDPASFPATLEEVIEGARKFVPMKRLVKVQDAARALAYQVRAEKPRAPRGNCYNCGEPGHYAKDCKKMSGSEHQPARNDKPAAVADPGPAAASDKGAAPSQGAAPNQGAKKPAAKKNAAKKRAFAGGGSTYTSRFKKRTRRGRQSCRVHGHVYVQLKNEKKGGGQGGETKYTSRSSRRTRRRGRRIGGTTYI